VLFGGNGDEINILHGMTTCIEEEEGGGRRRRRRERLQSCLY